MKNLKLIFVSLVLLGSVYSAKAETTSAMEITTEFAVIKAHTWNVFVHKGKKYHFRTGKWYVKRGRKYIQVRPPVGLAIRHLPHGNKIIHINGRKLFKYKGTWYKKKGRGYVIIKK